MTVRTRRTWLTRALALAAGSALLLVGCSSPSGSGDDEVEPVDVTSATAPALVDPASLGWESADASALAAYPALAELAGDCGVEVVAAARQVLGVRCSSDAGASVLYSDTTSDQVWSAADLVVEDGRTRLADSLVAAGAAASADAPGLLDDLRFDAAGNLLVVMGDGTTWQVPATEAGELLSDGGRVVRGAVRAGGDFTGSSAQAPAGAPVVAAASLQLPPPAAKPRGTGGGGGDVDCSVLKCLAITFDDGPGPYTEKLLDILAARDAKATFFMLGSLVGGRPDTVKRMVDEGHEVANHSWNHPDLRTLDAAGVASQMSRTQDAIEAASGVRPDLMRPPYGATNDTVLSVLRDQGLAVINWDVDTEDWKNRNVAETTSRALSGAHQGAIILFHDIHPSTVDAAPGIIDALQSQGYTLVTVGNLLGETTPGTKYFSAK
ncbi:peptidoglycan/xylan/chitin deacetylase (PgdA/CDA1 family) [Salana multivorans]|uniref:Peptidoglycan/xylan/chitin deacetylase (PgdA/CDA1 family) n=1 Tax=Salana multivorans TaxID=120377 RepID=A0A3N2DA15_9MICO|nr:polysaccharide deacetylase family protein [Salana multivorans]ROR96553.1 peptidoglycan/xylan/chitin deacetylase (PgdA/CDA1 family) [Salana multivorans]